MSPSIKLHHFVEHHRPRADNVPVLQDTLRRYDGQLPSALLELWQAHGLGYYGDCDLCLVAPEAWQEALDGWIDFSLDPAQWLPIALLPFGSLVCCRRLSTGDEEIALLNAVTRQIQVFGGGVADFFNRRLCDPASLDTLVPSDFHAVAREQAKELGPGEVYYVVSSLLSMQVLKITRVDARQLHRTLRGVDDDAGKADGMPGSILAALPAAYRDVFTLLDVEQGGFGGFYLSSYFDHRLLALAKDGTYRLLFWSTDPRDLTSRPRFYQGAYGVDKTGDGDYLIRLAIELRADSLGSDANDETLHVLDSGGLTWLLRAEALGDIADKIGFDGRMGRQDNYLQRVGLSDAMPGHDSEGAVAPPWDDLPRSLQALVHVEPLRATIVSIGEPDESEMVMVKVDLGTKDGLRMNMPLMSPLDSPRPIRGWVWDLDTDSCGVGLELEVDDADRIVNAPQVGDVLVTHTGSR